MARPEILNSGWLDPETRALVARAVFAEIAISAGGIWDPRDLEAEVRKRNNDRRGLRDRSNYKNMWSGKHEPSKSILMEALRAYPDAQVIFWAEHPLFFLLNKPKRDSSIVSQASVAYALNSIPGPLRALIWKSELSYDPWTGHQLHQLHASRMSDIMGDSLFDELPALLKITIATALAKYAMAMDDDKSFVRASRLTNGCFVEAIATTSNLYIQWRQLQSSLASQLWSLSNDLTVRELQLSLDHSQQVTKVARLLKLSHLPDCV